MNPNEGLNRGTQRPGHYLVAIGLTRTGASGLWAEAPRNPAPTVSDYTLVFTDTLDTHDYWAKPAMRGRAAVG